jgi:Secretion system C-terminal sorting domain
MGLARNPNGTGPFVIQQQTFAGNNNNISVEDIFVKADVRIFPNPCRDVVYVKSEKRVLELLVYNQQGQLVDNVGNSNRIDFTTRTSGIYTLMIKLEDGEQYTSRVVRQ